MKLKLRQKFFVVNFYYKVEWSLRNKGGVGNRGIRQISTFVNFLIFLNFLYKNYNFLPKFWDFLYKFYRGLILGRIKLKLQIFFPFQNEIEMSAFIFWLLSSCIFCLQTPRRSLRDLT